MGKKIPYLVEQEIAVHVIGVQGGTTRSRWRQEK
jgi:hypothetical protein